MLILIVNTGILNVKFQRNVALHAQLIRFWLRFCSAPELGILLHVSGTETLTCLFASQFLSMFPSPSVSSSLSCLCLYISQSSAVSVNIFISLYES